MEQLRRLLEVNRLSPSLDSQDALVRLADRTGIAPQMNPVDLCTLEEAREAAWMDAWPMPDWAGQIAARNEILATDPYAAYLAATGTDPDVSRPLLPPPTPKPSLERLIGLDLTSRAVSLKGLMPWSAGAWSWVDTPVTATWGDRFAPPPRWTERFGLTRRYNLTGAPLPPNGATINTLSIIPLDRGPLYWRAELSALRMMETPEEGELAEAAGFRRRQGFLLWWAANVARAQNHLGGPLFRGVYLAVLHAKGQRLLMLVDQLTTSGWRFSACVGSNQRTDRPIVPTSLRGYVRHCAEFQFALSPARAIASIINDYSKPDLWLSPKQSQLAALAVEAIDLAITQKAANHHAYQNQKQQTGGPDSAARTALDTARQVGWLCAEDPSGRPHLNRGRWIMPPRMHPITSLK